MAIQVNLLTCVVMFFFIEETCTSSCKRDNSPDCCIPALPNPNALANVSNSIFLVIKITPNLTDS